MYKQKGNERRPDRSRNVVAEGEKPQSIQCDNLPVDVKRWRIRHGKRPNENKMSDGGRRRASLGAEVWKSFQKWSAQRSAVRSIAWLDLRRDLERMVELSSCFAADSENNIRAPDDDKEAGKIVGTIDRSWRAEEGTSCAVAGARM